ncbi:MAG: hypothetical protein AB7G93_08855 [Bdellovibrionales bacterium]
MGAWFLRIWLFLTAVNASATPVVFDANVFYFTDDFTYNNASSAYKRTFWDVMIGLGLNKKASWVVGWNYGSMTFTENPGTETSLTVTDMGPKLLVYLDRNRTWALGFTYNLITTADYSTSGVSTELRGTSLRGEFGYLPEMWEGIYMGAKLNYYQASFKEEVSSSTLTEVTHSRTTIYPSFAFTWRWD